MRLWRSTSGNLGSWEEVAKFQGWDTSSSSFETFKGALYVGSEWIISETGETLPAQILRSYDGVNWESVIIAGFGDLTNINVYGLEQKASYLYAGTGSFEGGGDIWRTKDGVNWQPITTDGLGNLNNLAFGFVTYQNLLYTYSVNFDGILVYSSKDGVRWTPASEPGLGDSRNIVIWYERGRVVFKGGLYMSAGAGGVYKLAKP